MYPELEPHFAAIDAARAAYSAACREARGRHDPAGGPDECPGCRITDSAWAAFIDARTDAFAALKDCADPLVRWIADNCADEVGAALAAVRILPAPMSALDALAREQRWCEEYDDLRAKARKAGVLPADDTADTEVSA